MTDLASNELALAPLGAGDLIDRAVRFYRKFFWTFILIAAPPIIIGTLVYVGWTLLARDLFTGAPNRYSSDNFLYYIFLWLGNAAIWLIESIATLIVMGGASRNLVRHILFAEPMSFRETYGNVLNRLAGLVGASTVITLTLSVLGFAVFYMALLLISVTILLLASSLASIPILAILLGIVAVVAEIVFSLWLFFMAASRLAYVPQVMLVEGQAVFPAMSRSASLAGKSTRRLIALFAFTTVAAYSALALLYVPLLWYAGITGVDLTPFAAQMKPAWYEIAANVIWQMSIILMSPVWVIGLCLLYIDERVRKEGYDIELMAARRLGDIPDVPSTYVNPLQPALAVNVPQTSRRGMTTLGLE